MVHRVVASRYAGALFAAALDAGAWKQVDEDFPALVETVVGNEEFRDFLFHPAIGAAEKKGVAERTLRGKIAPVLYDFLMLVIEKRREVYLPLIQEKYRELVMKHEGVKQAVVHTAFPLTGDQRERLAGVLGGITGLKITVEEIVEPALLGGIRVRVGDLVIDGTLLNGLRQEKEHLTSARVH
ncbi:MAG: ATP synthase F1 subunit delta [bacterium]